jgi:type IX secretion system PorP/SprF family membrane protein
LQSKQQKQKKMKKISLVGLLACLWLVAWPSQDPLYSQFMTNPFLINPALTGTYPYYQIITNNRIQWTGLTGAPITNTLSMYGPFKSQPMGVGGYIMSDMVGEAESRISINGSYAYNYAIAEDLKISMGLMLGIMQHKIDGSKLRIEDPNDQAFQEGQMYSNIKPDATVGVYVYSSTYNGGISVTNLFGNKLQFDNPESTDTVPRSTIGRLKQHFYIHGGYKYYVNRDLAIEPTLIIKKAAATTPQVDFNVRAWYGQRAWDGTKVWGGISYRSEDALSVLIGVVYQRKIEVGYSYDIGLNKISPYNNGSHEIMITFRFNNFQEL